MAESFDDEAAADFVAAQSASTASFDTQAQPDLLMNRVRTHLPDAGSSQVAGYLDRIRMITDYVNLVVNDMGSVPVVVGNYGTNEFVLVPGSNGEPNWAALSDEDLQWIIDNHPERLIGQDISPEARQAAAISFQLNNASDLTVQQTTVAASIEVDIHWVEIGAGIQASVSHRYDGSAVVTVRVDAKAGVEIETPPVGGASAAEVDIGVNGSYTLVYTFPPGYSDQADQLVSDTRTAVTDDLDPTDVDDALNDYSQFQTGEIWTAGVGVRGRAGAPQHYGGDAPEYNGPSMSAAAGYQHSWNTFTGVDTHKFSLSGSLGDASLGVDISHSTAENGQPVAVEVGLDVSLDHDLANSLRLPVNSSGIKANVDMSDPYAVAAYDEFRNDPLNRDNINNLLAASTVTVSQTRSVVDESDKSGFETVAGGVIVNSSLKVDAGVQTLIRPPGHEEFITINPVTIGEAEVRDALADRDREAAVSE